MLLNFACRWVAGLSAVVWGFIAAPGALAWGPDGHEIVASVAFRNLDPRLVARAQELLTDENLFVQYEDRDGNRRRCHARNLREIASWADCVRYNPDPRYAVTGDFHFDDIPCCGRIPPKDRYCRDGNCGSAALVRLVDLGRNSRASARDRAEALAFVIHITGDLHQPLHTITNNDAGGNGVDVTVARGVLPGARRSLKFHSFWDGSMVLAGFRDVGEATRAADALAAQNASRWRRQRDPDEWVRDAHAIAVEAYDRLPRPPACGDRSANGGEIDAAYAAHFTPIVRQQLARGAVRLRDVLVRALAT